MGRVWLERRGASNRIQENAVPKDKRVLTQAGIRQGMTLVAHRTYALTTFHTRDLKRFPAMSNYSLV